MKRIMAATFVAVLLSGCGGHTSHYNAAKCKQAKLIQSIFKNESDPTTNAFLGTKPPSKANVDQVNKLVDYFCTK